MFKDLMDTIGFVTKYDKEVGEAMNAEFKRQQRNIELIASESPYKSPTDMEYSFSCRYGRYGQRSHQ